MNNYPFVLAAVIAVAACACSKSEQSATQAPPPPTQNDKVLLDMATKPLNKAKSVEGILQQDERQTGEAIEKQEAPSH